MKRENKQLIIFISVLLVLFFIWTIVNVAHYGKKEESTLSKETIEESKSIEQIEETETEETKENKIETETESASTSNVIFSDEFTVDGERLSISLEENNGEYSLNASGNAKTTGKATVMLLQLKSSFESTSVERYSILIHAGDLYVLCGKSSIGTIMSGVNSDGSMCMTSPDWLNLDDISAEEVESYSNEVSTALNEFAKGLSE